MSVYKRGETWHYDFMVAGRRYRGSTKEHTRSRARMIEAMLIANVREQRPSLIPKRAPIVREFASRFLTWVDNSQLAAESKEYYQRGWKSPANVPTDPGQGRRMGVIRVAPRVRLVKEYGRSVLIDADMEVRLLAVASQPLTDVLIIILDCGCRPSEVFLLRWEYIDWRTRTIFIPFGKTRNARRRLPMTQRVADALLARMPNKPEGWVFPSKQSKTGHITTVAKAWRNARDKAGVPKSVVMYCARHTFGTVAATSGNMFAVKTAMGHA